MMTSADLARPLPDIQGRGGQDEMRRLATELEANFLSTMLKESGFGKHGAFGGGVGEEQFSSFLRDIHATAMAEAGGIGLAESIYRALAGSAE